MAYPVSCPRELVGVHVIVSADLSLSAFSWRVMRVDVSVPRRVGGLSIIPPRARADSSGDVADVVPFVPFRTDLVSSELAILSGSTTCDAARPATPSGLASVAWGRWPGAGAQSPRGGRVPVVASRDTPLPMACAPRR